MGGLVAQRLARAARPGTSRADAREAARAALEARRAAPCAPRPGRCRPGSAGSGVRGARRSRGSRSTTSWPSARRRSATPSIDAAHRAVDRHRRERRLEPQRDPQPAAAGAPRTSAYRRSGRPRRGHVQQQRRVGHACGSGSPATLSPYQCSSSGASEMRSRWGLRPTSPQQDAGMRIEPAPSEAVAAAHRPAATAARAAAARAARRAVGVPGVARDPERRPLGGAHDRQLGQVGLAEDDRARRAQPRHEVVVALRRAAVAAVPQVVTSPPTSSVSLTAIGTPSSGRSSPAPRRASACSASTSARSPVTVRNAFSSPVEALDPLQVELDQLARGDLAAADHAPPGGRRRRRRGRRDPCTKSNRPAEISKTRRTAVAHTAARELRPARRPVLHGQPRPRRSTAAAWSCSSTAAIRPRPGRRRRLPQPRRRLQLGPRARPARPGEPARRGAITPSRRSRTSRPPRARAPSSCATGWRRSPCPTAGFRSRCRSSDPAGLRALLGAGRPDGLLAPDHARSSRAPPSASPPTTRRSPRTPG